MSEQDYKKNLDSERLSFRQRVAQNASKKTDLTNYPKDYLSKQGNYMKNLILARANSTRNSYQGEKYEDEGQDSDMDMAADAYELLKTPKWKLPFKAAQFGNMLRRKIDDHENSPFIILFIIALITDSAEIIPGGFIVALSLQIIFLFALWGRGRFKKKIFLKILIFCEFIPFLEMLPLNAIVILWIWHQSRKEADEAGKQLEKIERNMKKFKKEQQEAYAQ